MVTPFKFFLALFAALLLAGFVLGMWLMPDDTVQMFK